MRKKKKENIKDNDGYWIDCDFIGGACDSQSNAKNHYKISEFAAENINYGFAVSHLILAGEELIKSLIFILLSRELHFMNNSEKQEILRNHNIKHINIEEFLLSLTEDAILDFEENLLEYTVYPDKMKNKYQEAAWFLHKSLKLDVLDEKEISEISKLIKDANDLKNKGLYVDYENNWQCPWDVTEETYTKYRNLITKLFEFIDPVFTIPLTDERIQDFLYGE